MSDELWRALSEIAGRITERGRNAGFASMVRWLAIHEMRRYDLMSLLEDLAGCGLRRVPDGWLVADYGGLLIVAVFEQDDTHSDTSKWRHMAQVFDASGSAMFVEFRRHRDGPIAIKSEGALYFDMLAEDDVQWGEHKPPASVEPAPWTGLVTELRCQKASQDDVRCAFERLLVTEEGAA